MVGPVLFDSAPAQNMMHVAALVMCCVFGLATAIAAGTDVHLHGVIASSDIDFFAGNSVRYVGPATIVGGNIVVHELVAGEIMFDNIAFDGAGTLDSVFDHCIQSTNVTIINSQFSDWHGKRVLCANASVGTEWHIDNITMSNVSDAAIRLHGVDRVSVTNSRFDECGIIGAHKPCIYIAMPWYDTPLPKLENITISRGSINIRLMENVTYHV